ncbi:hypothetical protein O181_105478 [Austropuccinia psidii MF-1]|uniref:Uncharacterized protein n=1 Tax=Austropuccinia psidii MF-1 TaxID=1389203 RepID=A0A9Q3JM60_9BASI|nr:hypothetical protein [Austropuccinia psidii MF-1]
MCPCYEQMDSIFGKKPNVSAFDEMDSTKAPTVIDVSEEEGESDLDGSGKSESGLSAYEIQQRRTKHQQKVQEKAVNDLPTVTPTSEVSDVVAKNLSNVALASDGCQPKPQLLFGKGRKKTLKDRNIQEDQDNEQFHMKLFENFIKLQHSRWSEEKIIVKEKNERDYTLEKEKFERQLRFDAEAKDTKKTEKEREYNLEKEKFERQLRLDIEDKEKCQRDYNLERECMEGQFDLEKERIEREAVVKEKQTRLATAHKLLLLGKTSEEIAEFMKVI